MMPSQLGGILDAIIADLKATETMPETIATYHKVEGMVPGIDPSASLWVPKQTFKQYDNEMDEVDAEIHIGVCVEDLDAESGEERIRALAEEIRFVLTSDDPRLGGLLDDSFLTDWQFATYNASQTEVVHMGEAVWSVTYYAARERLVTSNPNEDVVVDASILNQS